ncbi:MAG: hypothetical protein WCJ17_00305 [bacterium]
MNSCFQLMRQVCILIMFGVVTVGASGDLLSHFKQDEFGVYHFKFTDVFKNNNIGLSIAQRVIHHDLVVQLCKHKALAGNIIVQYGSDVCAPYLSFDLACCLKILVNLLSRINVLKLGYLGRVPQLCHPVNGLTLPELFDPEYYPFLTGVLAVAEQKSDLWLPVVSHLFFLFHTYITHRGGLITDIDASILGLVQGLNNVHRRIAKEVASPPPALVFSSSVADHDATDLLLVDEDYSSDDSDKPLTLEAITFLENMLKTTDGYMAQRSRVLAGHLYELHLDDLITEYVETWVYESGLEIDFDDSAVLLTKRHIAILDRYPSKAAVQNKLYVILLMINLLSPDNDTYFENDRVWPILRSFMRWVLGVSGVDDRAGSIVFLPEEYTAENLKLLLDDLLAEEGHEYK